MLAAAAFARGGAADPGQTASVEATAHRPPANLDLAEEHAQSLMVIRQAGPSCGGSTRSRSTSPASSTPTTGASCARGS